MRRVHFVLIVMFALAPLELGRFDALAQKPPAPLISKDRPFHKTLPRPADEQALVDRVLKGEEAALATFRAAGLTYVPRLFPHFHFHPEVCRAYTEYRDWIGAMQRWEVVLIQADASDFGPNWDGLAKRFVDPNAQLARAVLYAHYAGEPAIRDALIKRAPASPWIKGAAAWAGLTTDPRQAVADLLAVLPMAEEMQGRHLHVYARHFDGEERDPGMALWEDIRKDFEDITSEAAVRELRMCPEHLRPELIVERVAMIASEAADAKLVDEAAQKVAQAAKTAGTSFDAAKLYEVAARPGSEKVRSLGDHGVRAVMGDTIGTSMLAYAFTLLPSAWVEQAFAGTAAWAATPESINTRRLMLSRVMCLGDPLLTRLAARGVLACHEEDIGAVSDLARALSKFSNEKELLKTFCDALKATGNADLVKIADAALAASSTALDPLRRGKLSLTLEQRTALLRPFVNQAEVDTTGGIRAVYWLNRATFMEGQRNMRAATDAYWEAMAAAGVETRDKEMSPTVFAWLLFCERNLPDDMAITEMDRRLRKQTKLATTVRSLFDALRDREAPPAVNAWVRALGDHKQRKDLAPDVAEQFEKHPQRHGGIGQALLAAQALRQGKYSLRKSLHEGAVAMSPLDPLVHMCIGPEDEVYGTYRGANWDVACRHAIALTLLQPFSIETIYDSNLVLLRTGLSALSINCRGAGAILRRPACNWASPAMRQVFMLSICRYYNFRVLHRMILARPETAKGRKHLHDAMFYLAHPYEGDRILRATAAVSGPARMYPAILMDQLSRRAMAKDVNELLNYAYSCALFFPEASIELVGRAEAEGVSKYGRFVGLQGLLLAHGQLGTLGKLLDEYRETRGGRVGNPPALDQFLLAGLTRGNNLKEAPAAKAILDDFTFNDKDSGAVFVLRRFYMMLGLHDQVGGLPLPTNAPVHLEDAAQYTALFHESRSMLDSDNFEELIKRAEPYLKFEVEAGMGVYADAVVLCAIALKVAGKVTIDGEKPGRLKVADAALADALNGSHRTLDTEVLDLLCGRRDLQSLSEWSEFKQWHGELFAERTGGALGSGTMSFGEAAARDKFMRGAIEWLRGDEAKARSWLEECVKRNQRNSHEYHVAEWLLANPLKPKEGK